MPLINHFMVYNFMHKYEEKLDVGNHKSVIGYLTA
jgi:hypothetical protein